MATVGDLVINLLGKADQFKGTVDFANRQLTGLSVHARMTAGQVNTALAAMKPPPGKGGLFAGLPGLAAGIPGIPGIPGIGKFIAGAASFAGIKKALDMSQEQLTAEKKLASVIRSTGMAAGFSAKELYDYAGALQKVTNFGDEVTISGMAVLATFREIKGATFKEAIVAAQDLSTVMGQDLQSSVVQIGKALQNPAVGLTALRRAGVSFTAQQTAQILEMQKSGNLLGAQKAILSELKTEFGGAAEALANPMKQAKNAVGDLAETIGFRLAPYVKLGAAALRDFAAGGAEAANQRTPTSNAGIGQMSLGQKVASFDWWAKGTSDLLHYTSVGVDALGFLGTTIKGAVTGNLTETGKAYDALKERFMDMTPSEKLDAMAAAAARAAAQIKPIPKLIDPIHEALEKVGSAWKEWSATKGSIFSPGFTGPQQAAKITETEDWLKQLLAQRESGAFQSPREKLNAMLGVGMNPQQAAMAEKLVGDLETQDKMKLARDKAKEYEDALKSLGDEMAKLRDKSAGMMFGLTTEAAGKYADLRKNGMAAPQAVAAAKEWSVEAEKGKATDGLRELDEKIRLLTEDTMGLTAAQREYNRLTGKGVESGTANELAQRFGNRQEQIRALEIQKDSRSRWENLARERKELEDLRPLLGEETYRRRSFALAEKGVEGVPPKLSEQRALIQNRFDEAVKSLGDDYAAGKLDDATFRDAKRAESRKYAAAMSEFEGPSPLAGAMEAGSREAWSAIMKAMPQSQQEKSEEKLQKAAELQIEAATSLKDLIELWQMSEQMDF